MSGRGGGQSRPSVSDAGAARASLMAEATDAPPASRARDAAPASAGGLIVAGGPASQRLVCESELV